MTNGVNSFLDCKGFEDLLTDYLDKSLEPGMNATVASHALSCPICHALLNDVKASLEACRHIAGPVAKLTRLEARIISMTAPETAMTCDDFENSLTDYLDGFLPAAAFHRWERHAALCSTCEDLPGTVVRSIAACYTYKMDELAVPAGLHERILTATLGTTDAEGMVPSWTTRAADWVRGLRFPIAAPQLAPVAMILMFAFLVFSHTVSTDGSLTGVYQRSIELAGQTYQQGADAWNGKPTSFMPQQPAEEAR